MAISPSPALVVSSPSITSAANPDLIGANWKTYTSGYGIYSVKYPIGWELIPCHDKNLAQWTCYGIENSSVLIKGNVGYGIGLNTPGITFESQDNMTVDQFIGTYIKSNKNISDFSRDELMIGGNKFTKISIVDIGGLKNYYYLIMVSDKNTLISVNVIGQKRFDKDDKEIDYIVFADQILSTFKFVE